MLPTRRHHPAQAPTPAALLKSATDALVESYVEWRAASSGVREAYQRWLDWRSHDREVAFAGYLAALQQEEHAARLYQRRVETVLGTFRSASRQRSPSEAAA